MRQRTVRTGCWRTILAIGLLYVFVLQSLLAPVLAATAPRDGMPAGQVLCSDLNTAHTTPADQPAAHHQDCCDIGCPMRVASLDVPFLAFAAVDYPLLAGRWHAAPHGVVSATGPPRPDRSSSPQSPRAPPTFVI